MEKYPYRRLVSLAMLLVVATSQLTAKVVDASQAARVAATYMSATHVSDGQPMRVKQFKPAAGNRLAAPADEAPAFYIFTTAEGKGFAIISADDAAMPVLGYSDSQSIDINNLPPALEALMNQWTEQIRQARSQGLEPSAKVKAMWARAYQSAEVVNLATAQWDQHAPFYNECPTVGGEHCLSGCVPTQYAIIMRYYKYARPVIISTTPYTSDYGTFVPSRDIDGLYDWDNMPLTYSAGGYGDERDDAVARLIADIGAVCYVNYGLTDTSTLHYRPQLLDLFGYQYEKPIYRDDFTAAEWDAKLKDCLDRQHPISYSAQDPDKNGAHAFVIDGYNADGMYHINWGWGEYYSGYFALDALCAGGYYFKTGHTAILNICPIDATDHNIPDCVAQVGDRYFSELAYSIDYACYTGEEIQLLKDIDAGSSNVFWYGTGSMDLSGHTITSDWLVVDGNLTLRDTSDGSIKIAKHINVSKDSKCTIQGVAIANNGNNFLFQCYSELNLYDCDVKITGSNYIALVDQDATMNVYSGRYKSLRSFYGDGKVNVYGGMFSFNPSAYLAEGATVAENTDPETAATYPYVVESAGGINSAVEDSAVPVGHYSVDGRKLENPRAGTIVITKHADGSVSKKLLP